MVELLTLDMVKKNYVTNVIVLDIGYDISNCDLYDGDVKRDYYGRVVPKPAHGTIRIDHFTSSTKVIGDKVIELFDSIVDKHLLTRRINISVCNLKDSNSIKNEEIKEQLNLFSYDKVEINKKRELEDEENERRVQKAIIDIKNKYGKNAILKAMNLEEGGTTIERNNQVGGHRA